MPTTEEHSKAFTEACILFVHALAAKDLPDRDAIWSGVKAALALYTVSEDYDAMQTMVDRLRKWNEATINR